MIIPTRDRAAQLAECLAALARQDEVVGGGGGGFEVLIGIDGPVGEEEAIARRTLGGIVEFRIIGGAQCGPAAVRNRLIEIARGELLVFLNDDVVPEPSLVRLHAEAQAAWDRPAMMLGASPWRVFEDDRVVDRMVRETSAVFFYDQMVGARSQDRAHDWGYRHAWTLNLSVERKAIDAVGGFCEKMARPVYEDIELAYRLQQEAGMAVLYRPEAVVEHVHRYEPAALLAREVVLGHQAHRLAEVSPACALDIFGFDHLDRAAIERAWTMIELEAETAMSAQKAFCAQAARRCQEIRDDEINVAVEDCYDAYRAARGRLRRLGWLAAVDGVGVEVAVTSALRADERAAT